MFIPIRELRKTINSEEAKQNDPHTVSQAIKELGRLGAVAAIDDLAKLIAFRQKFDWENLSDGKIVYSAPPHLISVLEYYPAAGALHAIGKPSLPALIRVIESNAGDSIQNTNAYQTIVLMLRDNKAARVKLFRTALANATSKEVRQRLSEALEKVKGLQ